jgi:PAS domain S-box-containing protein
MGSLRHDDVAVFLRRAEGTAKILGTKVEQFSNRVRLLPRRPSGVYATRPTSAPPEPAASSHLSEIAAGDEELTLAAEELRVQQDQLELACELLERERAKYMDLFEQSPDAYVATDTSGSITNANVAAGALFGVEPGLLVGKPLISFVARQDTRAFREQLRDLKDAPDLRSMTLRMRPRGGGVFLVALCVRVVRGLRGKSMSLRCTLRKTDALAATASWLDELVEHATGQNGSSEVVDLAEHLERAANAVRGAAAARSVRVVLDSERRTWRVLAQLPGLRRMLDVLFSEAVFATPSEGELRIRVVVEGQRAVLDVTPHSEHENAPTIRIRMPLLA